jgi:hypothetical protein
VGLAFSLTALVLHYRLGRRTAAKAVLTGLIGAASLEAFFGYCLGCKMFALGMRTGVVPERVCEECNNIWARQPARV